VKAKRAERVWSRKDAKLAAVYKFLYLSKYVFSLNVWCAFSTTPPNSNWRNSRAEVLGKIVDGLIAGFCMILSTLCVKTCVQTGSKQGKKG
jgi:hypothetical protein